MGLRLKDMTVGVFAKLSTDEELLNLLEVPSRSMKDIKYQIVDDKYPHDLVESDLSRICFYETPPTNSLYSIIERSYIEIDIYVLKDKNRLDKRILRIANRLYELLHNSKIDDTNIKYFTRLPDLPTGTTEWAKYGIVFFYNNIIL